LQFIPPLSVFVKPSRNQRQRRWRIRVRLPLRANPRLWQRPTRLQDRDGITAANLAADLNARIDSAATGKFGLQASPNFIHAPARRTRTAYLQDYGLTDLNFRPRPKRVQLDARCRDVLFDVTGAQTKFSQHFGLHEQYRALVSRPRMTAAQ
jgi:hypothetical protein